MTQTMKRRRKWILASRAGQAVSSKAGQALAYLRDGTSITFNEWEAATASSLAAAQKAAAFENKKYGDYWHTFVSQPWEPRRRTY